MQKREDEKKSQDKSKTNSYGAWGPVFKNRDNFVNMHVC